MMTEFLWKCKSFEPYCRVFVNFRGRLTGGHPDRKGFAAGFVLPMIPKI